MGDGTKDSADRRPETGCSARGPGLRLRVGAIIAGAVLALACLDGAASALARDAGVLPDAAGVTMAAKPDKPDKPNKGERDDDKQSDHGAGLGRLVRGELDEDRADDLADELRDCLNEDDLEDMRGGQVKHLARAAGLSKHELKEILAEDDEPGRGLGRLARDGLSEGQADNVADELRDRLEAEDLEDLKVGHLLQAAHACGITTHELKELLAGD
jgi:hypothetical protein